MTAPGHAHDAIAEQVLRAQTSGHLTAAAQLQFELALLLWGRGLKEQQRQRWLGLLLECADEIGTPSDPEFRSALLAYLEWGTRLALINSQPGATVRGEEPMPVWGWGETKGPYVK